MTDWLGWWPPVSRREYSRVRGLADGYFYALLKAGEQLANCSCKPHVQGKDGALMIIERELDYHFPSRYRDVWATPPSTAFRHTDGAD